MYDRLKSQAASAEAMWLGATIGAAGLAGKLEEVRSRLDSRSKAYDEALAYQISALCDRDAYKTLAEALMKEMMDASKAGRLLIPGSHRELARLLQDAHMESWKRIVEKTRQNKKLRFTVEAEEISRKVSRAKVKGYLDALSKFA